MKLIFVYNANSGTANAMLDSMHKVLSPDTYACNLCDITHGLIGENKTWRAFREETDIPMVFLHRDEFVEKYGETNRTFPVVLQETDKGLELFISTEDLEDLDSAESLIVRINQTTN